MSQILAVFCYKWPLLSLPDWCGKRLWGITHHHYSDVMPGYYGDINISAQDRAELCSKLPFIYNLRKHIIKYMLSARKYIDDGAVSVPKGSSWCCTKKKGNIEIPQYNVCKHCSILLITSQYHDSLVQCTGPCNCEPDRSAALLDRSVSVW